MVGFGILETIESNQSIQKMKELIRAQPAQRGEPEPRTKDLVLDAEESSSDDETLNFYSNINKHEHMKTEFPCKI